MGDAPHPSPIEMALLFLGLLLLLPPSFLGHAVPQSGVMDDVISLVESGLSDSPKEGRALLITLTVNETTFTVSSVLSTNTQCVATAISSCPASSRSNLDNFVNVGLTPAILTTTTGQKVDVDAIQPTRARSQLEGLDVDGIIHEDEDALSSGTLTYREVLFENKNPSCGRSEGVQRRPRFVVANKNTITNTYSTTSYTSTVITSTGTFTIPTNYCTDSNYPSTGFFATASVC